MASTIWRLLINVFLAATIRYVRASKIFAYTANALANAAATDSRFRALSDFFAPLNDDFQLKYNNWVGAGGTQEASTLARDQAIGNMTHDLEVWESMIVSTYLPSSPGFKNLFPDGHRPFSKSVPHNELVSALRQLSDKLASAPKSLAPVKELVDAKLAAVSGATAVQQGSKEDVGSKRGLMEAARIEAADGLQYVYGGLIQIYYKDMMQIARFYDVATIRDIQQSTYTGTVAAGGHHFIVKRTMEGEDDIRLHNTGTVPLQFYFASGKKGLPPADDPYIVAPGGDVTVNASAIGNAAGPYLIVYNPDAAAAGSWEVQL